MGRNSRVEMEGEKQRYRISRIDLSKLAQLKDHFPCCTSLLQSCGTAACIKVPVFWMAVKLPIENPSENLTELMGEKYYNKREILLVTQGKMSIIWSFPQNLPSMPGRPWCKQ